MFPSIGSHPLTEVHIQKMQKGKFDQENVIEEDAYMSCESKARVLPCHFKFVSNIGKENGFKLWLWLYLCFSRERGMVFERGGYQER